MADLRAPGADRFTWDGFEFEPDDRVNLDWDEAAHPRDEGGRFVESGAVSTVAEPPSVSAGTPEPPKRFDPPAQGQTRRIPENIREAAMEIKVLGGVKDVAVDDHYAALKAAPIVADTLYEMRTKNYAMPDVLFIELARGKDIDPSGKLQVTAEGQIGNRRLESTLTIRVPPDAPRYASMDTLVDAAFSGKVATSAGDRQIDKYAVRTMKDIVVHEMGHRQHGLGLSKGALRDFADVNEDLDREFGAGVGLKMITKAAEQVSDYAKTNSAEFIAEAFTRMYRGETLPPEAMDLYKRLEGPRVK